MRHGNGENIESSAVSWHMAYAMAAVCVATPVLYVLYTGNIWEDFFITFKYSENLANGAGLVYEPGVKVHGFTSPLGVLLPALTHLLSFRVSYVHALWLFRILFCLPAFLAGGILFGKSAIGGKAWQFLFALLFALDIKAVMFSINGMETGLMLFFLGLSLYVVSRGLCGSSFLWGASWAGLMWTRPDSFVYIGALVFGVMLFGPDRKVMLRNVTKAALVCTVLYLPWFIWTWAYYGTPVPHTVTAKALAVRGEIDILGRTSMVLPKIFAPAYPIFPDWPRIIRWGSTVLGYICISSPLWLCLARKLREDKLLGVVSVMLALTCCYLVMIPYAYPWYFPPVSVLGLVAIFRVIDAYKGSKYLPPRLAGAVVVLVAGYFAYQFLLSTVQYGAQQAIIENGTRMEVGKWLGRHALPEDRIYVECLGYIGYFSKARMLDYPGLASPEVVGVLRKHKANFYTAVKYLEPEWVVLRGIGGKEAATMERFEFFRLKYEALKAFDSSAAVMEARDVIPGYRSLLNDSVFVVYKRSGEVSCGVGEGVLED